MHPTAQRPDRTWWFVGAAWLLIMLISASSSVGGWILNGRSYPVGLVILLELPRWIIFALLTPAIFYLGRRFPVQRPHLGRHLSIHLVTAVTIAALHAFVGTMMTLFLGSQREGSPGQYFIGNFLSGIAPVTLVYFGVLGAGMALLYFARHRDETLRAERLDAQLTGARLNALRSQIHPHFLFNSLNTILVHARDRDTDTVTRMLELLSDTLRLTLKSDARHEVPLQEELAFVRQYLEIEQVRFSDRLSVSITAQPEIEAALIPSFLLQPLVENAIRHGIGTRGGPGHLAIAARRNGTGLEITVTNDGADPPAVERRGVGLTNTTERLDALYGAAATFTLAPRPEGGGVATVRLPLRYGAPAESHA